MGRRAKGYTLRQQTKGGPWSARWTIDGKRDEYFTGIADRALADRAAREAYAKALRGEVVTSNGRGPVGSEVVAQWLDALPLRSSTVELYRKYTVWWLDELRTWDERELAAYLRKRLQSVKGKSVRTERSALANLLAWLVENEHLDKLPTLPKLPASLLGKPSKVRRRVKAPDYTESEIRKVIASLPDKSPTGFWVRPRFEFMYETGLRPSTVDGLSVPEHYSKGARSLRITEEIDKEGLARTVPLSDRARAILKRCAPPKGVVFGEHRYSHFVEDACTKAKLPSMKAAVFTGQHLRSARATHLLDDGAELTGVQHLLGHKYASTTALYVRPTEAAAARALAKVGAISGAISGGRRKK